MKDFGEGGPEVLWTVEVGPGYGGPAVRDGEVYVLDRVTGESEGSSVWGTDVYTGDSPLAVAAVHAGAVKAGETAVVRVTVTRPLTHYQGSVRNGVTSHDYGGYGTAYRVDRV